MATKRKRNDDNSTWYGKYNPDWGKEATKKYMKEKQRRIIVQWKKEEFEEIIEPHVQEANMTYAGFIKEAINEKIEKMKRAEKKAKKSAATK